jgi:uncharacterized membrane protein (UPF0127 family)
MQLRHNGNVVISQLRIARRMHQRVRGLLGTRSLETDEGLWITPCTSIHMWFMRYPIDVVFISRDLHVVRIHERLGPWRMARGGRDAHSVLELPAGSVARHSIGVGDALLIEPSAPFD